MKNESSKNAKAKPSLDQRFARRPHVYHRLHRIADMMDQAMAEGATADEAEAMAIQELQKLGGDVLTDWAEARQIQSVEQAQAEHPEAIRHIKKK
jgi:antirestriction protein